MAKKSTSISSISISRCKRIVRPLISKIHALTDMKSKYPTKLQFTSLEAAFSKVPLGHKACERSRPSSRNGFASQKSSILINKRKAIIVDDLMDEYDDDLSFRVSDEVPEEKPELLNEYVKFIRPETSNERLESLEPFVSIELYQSYGEILQIFRNIVLTLFPTPSRESVTKLSTLCSFQIGKSIALSTKSTYYMINRVSLFNPLEISVEAQIFNQDLNDDIDEWLEMPPSVVSLHYRSDLLMGYVIHLIIFNLRNLLYPLIPVLLHWLEEEFRVSGDQKLRTIMRTLFIEYWREGSDNKDQLNGTESGKFQLYWDFFKIGYWESLIESLDLQTLSGQSYDGLILESLTNNDRLSEMTSDISLEKDIYPIIKRNPQNSCINVVLINIMTQIIVDFKRRFHSSKTTEAVLGLFQETYQGMVEFLGLWISFGDSREMIFNSLYPGNEEIFEGIIKFVQYLTYKNGQIIRHLQGTVITKDRIQELQITLHQYKLLEVILRLLRSYYLDVECDNFEPGDLEQSSQAFLSIQGIKRRIKYSNYGLNEFLLWLNDNEYRAFCQYLYQKVYGQFNDEIYKILFKKRQRY